MTGKCPRVTTARLKFMQVKNFMVRENMSAMEVVPVASVLEWQIDEWQLNHFYPPFVSATKFQHVLSERLRLSA